MLYGIGDYRGYEIQEVACKLGITKEAVSDLITLNYRTQGWNASHRLYFFKTYYAFQRLSARYKTLARWISRKSLKKATSMEN